MESAERLNDINPNIELSPNLISTFHKVGMLFLDGKGLNF